MSTASVILVEADLVSPTGEPRTLRFADRAVRPCPPTDPDRPNAVWDDRLLEPPTLSRSLLGDLQSLTPGFGLGVMKLANGDGALTPYEAWTWSALRVWRHPRGAAFGGGVLLFSGQADTPAFSYGGAGPARVSVGFYDMRVELDAPVQGGFIGGGSAAAGRSKPLAYGDLRAAHVPAPLIDPATGRYQLHDGAVAGEVSIYDRGAAAGYVMDGDLSGAAFDAAAPAPAHAVTDNGRGLVRINGAPIGTVTFGLRGEGAGIGPILALVLGRLGVPAGRIDASVTGLDAPAAVGLWDGGGSSGRDLVTTLARSCLAAVLPGRDGRWTAARLAPPADEPALTLDPMRVVKVQADESAPLPLAQVRVGYDRLYQTFRGADLAPSLRSTNEQTRLSDEYRWWSASDVGLLARPKGSWRTLDLPTALRGGADAAELCGRVLAFFGRRPDGRPRRQWTVVAELTPEILGTPLGATVRLLYPALGLDERLVLIGEQPLRPRKDFTTWTLWG